MDYSCFLCCMREREREREREIMRTKRDQGLMMGKGMGISE